MFLGTTVQNGYAFWNEPVWLKCFAPSAVPGLLSGGFNRQPWPAISAHLQPHDQCFPYFITNGGFTTDNPLSSPKIPFTVLPQ